MGRRREGSGEGGVCTMHSPATVQSPPGHRVNEYVQTTWSVFPLIPLLLFVEKILVSQKIQVDFEYLTFRLRLVTDEL